MTGTLSEKSFTTRPISSDEVYDILITDGEATEAYSIPAVLYYCKVDNAAQQMGYLLNNFRDSWRKMNTLAIDNFVLQKCIVRYQTEITSHKKTIRQLNALEGVNQSLTRQLKDSKISLEILKTQNRTLTAENGALTAQNRTFRYLPSILLYGIASAVTLYAGHTILKDTTSTQGRFGAAALALVSWGTARSVAQQWHKKLTLLDEQLRRAIN